ncbi:hypothetical protein SM11_pC1088 (plasmid) [Sinorhizobium meliloti SM11]|uniref:Uncharacterized protein n=1 Tax=Sinorhizobium meliloti (strain SM11) TaxID=707241 RepID=F7XF36_SINMM|nr:hypothetical protein SM11_pC1088 [Sinorhizobium meliloti SM11]
MTDFIDATAQGASHAALQVVIIEEATDRLIPA